MSKLRISFTLLASTAALAIPAGAHAATDSYLSVAPGYLTETTSTSMKAVSGSMNVLSWNFGAARAGSGDAQRFDMNELTVVKYPDRNSPKAFTDLAQGTLLDQVTITTFRSGRTPQKFLKYCFRNATIASYKVGAAGPGEPTETITFNYTTMVTTFTPFDPGGRALAPIKAGWNAVTSLLLGNADLATC